MKLTRLFLAGIGSAAMLTLSAHAQTITQWTFDNDSTAQTANPAPSTGTGTATALGMTNTYTEPGLGNSVSNPDVTAGATGDTGSDTLADTTHEWRVRAKGTGSNNGNGWNSAAPIGTQGAAFMASTVGTTTGAINVSFDFYVTNQAEAEMEVLYTTNGGSTWTNLALNIPSASSGYLANETGSAADPNTVNGSYVLVTPSDGQEWFQGLNATITDPNALNDAGFGFEVVNASTGSDVTAASGGAYNNSSGNWRFDNVTISDVVATPEPTSWVLGLGAAGLFAVLMRRRHASRD